MLDERIIEIIEEGKGFVAILAGSGSDDKPKGEKPSHIDQIVTSLEAFSIPYAVHVCSAHKQTEKLSETIAAYNGQEYPVLLVAVAGGTDALSGTASWESLHPVLSCPPDAPNPSCLTNPPGSSNAYIARPANVGKYAAQMFSHLDASYRTGLLAQNSAKISGLINDNVDVGGKYKVRLMETRQ